MAIPAPHTLVARVSAVEEAKEREMLRLAEESIRRGHPGQAAIVYRKVAQRYLREGLTHKELAVLNMWVRVASHDPEAWTAMGLHHERAQHRRLALEALTRAAALWRSVGRDDDADGLEGRIRELRSGPVGASPSADLPESSPPEPNEMPGASVMATEDPEDDDQIELNIPQSGRHDAIDDDPAPREPERPPRQREPWPSEPERLPTGALESLPDEGPEPLSAASLRVYDEPAIPDRETEPGQTYDRTVGGLAAASLDAPTDDEISAELMAELTAMADEDVTGEEGAATIAMPSIGSMAKRGFNIPDAATVMDPNYRPPSMEAPEDDEFDYDDEEEDPREDRTRGYSADELKELDRLLKERGRR